MRFPHGWREYLSCRLCVEMRRPIYFNLNQ
jgi:hypothetical protein